MYAFTCIMVRKVYNNHYMCYEYILIYVMLVHKALHPIRLTSEEKK